MLNNVCFSYHYGVQRPAECRLGLCAGCVIRRNSVVTGLVNPVEVTIQQVGKGRVLAGSAELGRVIDEWGLIFLVY